jgi:hypothetical protein
MNLCSQCLVLTLLSKSFLQTVLHVVQQYEHKGLQQPTLRPMRRGSTRQSSLSRRGSDRDSNDNEDAEEEVAQNGLASRKRFDQMDPIISQNDHERRTQVQSNYVGNSMLQLLRLGGQGALEGGDMENCPMM